MYWHTLPCCIASKDASAAEGGFCRRPLRQQKVRVVEGDCQPATRIRLAAVKRDLHLFDHLCSRVTILLLLCPLFGNESGRTCVGLGMYGHLLPLVLPCNLLLMRRFCVFLGGNGRAATLAAGKMETATGTVAIV